MNAQAITMATTLIVVGTLLLLVTGALLALYLNNTLHFHTWSRWENNAKNKLSYKNEIGSTSIGVCIEQERRCTKCNKVQLRIEQVQL